MVGDNRGEAKHKVNIDVEFLDLRKKTKILKVVAFITLLAIIVVSVTDLLKYKRYGSWPNTKTVVEMYQLPTNSIDVVSLGPSSNMCSFDGLRLYGEYGVSAYNLGTTQQPVIASYYLLKDFLKTQTPKIVYLEMLCCFRKNDEANYRQVFDHMKFSRDKIKAVSEHAKVEGAYSTASYIFPLLQYHTRWKEVTQDNFNDEAANSIWANGYLLKSYVKDERYGGVSKIGNDRREMEDEAKEYLPKIIELCKSNGIELVLYSIPSKTYDGSMYNTCLDIAREYGVTYVPLFTTKSLAETGFSFATDTEGGNHPNSRGAAKITEKLYAVGKELVDLTDHRGDPNYAWLDEDYQRYVKNRENNTLLFNDVTLESYLPLLNNSRYTVFIAVRDQACNLSSAEQNQLKKLGLQESIIGKEHYRFSYLTVISNGKVKKEQISDASGQLLTYSSSLSNGTKYMINSKGNDGEGNLGYANIIIGGKEYSLNRRGINIVVYDNELESVIDRIVFDTHSSSKMSR